ncbi:MAG: alpha/beta hydrolase [Candidatus Spechtbacterales bacterium]
MSEEFQFVPDFVEIAGRRIHYAKAGSGPPIILLHGLGRSLFQWEEHFPELAKTNTVYAFDFPGFGQSEPLYRHEMSIFSATVFIEQFRRHFDIENPVLLGGSLGGLAALDYALEFSGNISKLILMGSAGLSKDIKFAYRLLTLPGVGELWKYLDYHGIEDAENWISRASAVPKIGKILGAIFEYALTPPEPARLKNTREENRGTFLKLFRHGFGLRGQKKAIRRDDKLHRIEVPTLVIWGELDPLFSVEQARRASTLFQDCKLYIFKNAGHWPARENPEEFNKVVKEFIAS